MADYQTKPGNGAIFKNDKKEKDTHPDYRGNIVDPNGNAWDLALWIKVSKGGKKYFSVSVKEPTNNPNNQTTRPAPAKDDDFPFIE